METQMTRIGYFLGSLKVQVCQTPPPPPQSKIPIRHEEMVDKMIEQEYQEVKPIPRVARMPPVVLVNRNQDPDHVVR